MTVREFLDEARKASREAIALAESLRQLEAEASGVKSPALTERVQAGTNSSVVERMNEAIEHRRQRAIRKLADVAVIRAAVSDLIDLLRNASQRAVLEAYYQQGEKIRAGFYRPRTWGDVERRLGYGENYAQQIAAAGIAILETKPEAAAIISRTEKVLRESSLHPVL